MNEEDLANVCGSFMECYLECVDMQHIELEQLKKEIKHCRKVINHLSRVIQNKNKKYKKLLDKKLPRTLYGREVIIVPDSIAKDIMIVDKKFFENYMEVKND